MEYVSLIVTGVVGLIGVWIGKRLDRSEFVHKLQFEKEFTTYVDLWEKAVAVQVAALDLNPSVEKFEGEEDRKRQRKEREEKFRVAYTDLGVHFSRLKPFVSPIVYKAAQDLLASTHSEHKMFTNPPSFEEIKTQEGIAKYHSKIRASTDSIMKSADDLCSAIRNRIWTEKEWEGRWKLKP